MPENPNFETHSYSDIGGYEPNVVLEDGRITGTYEPFNASGTMLPPDPELVNEVLAMEEGEDGTDEPDIHDIAFSEEAKSNREDTSFDPSTFDLVAPTGIENLRDDFPDAEPVIKHNPDYIQESDEEPEDGGYKFATYTGAEPSADVPASLDEDGELPSYSIYARYWPNPAEKADRKPLHYTKLACGHKLRGNGFEPNHRNCERCFFTFFQINGEFTKAVIEAHQTGGDELIIRLKGKTFLHNFKKFMSTVAFIQAQQEAASASKESQGS